MNKSFFGDVTLIFFGVLLPAAALIVEQLTGMCADTFHYDPIPTVFHVIAVVLVPVVFLTLGLARRTNDPYSARWRFSVGVVTGISVIYAVPLLPVVPLGLIGSLVGIGLLILAPIAAATLGFITLFKMWKSGESSSWWGSAGVFTAFFVLTAMAYPAIMTDRAMDKLSSADEGTRLEAFQLLRKVDVQTVKDRLCEYRRTLTPNPVSLTLATLDGPSIERSPELFWRVTGTTCPDHGWQRGQGPKSRPGLRFASSRLDASVDAANATGYTEWLYEVKNSDEFNREADFTVQLPPGSVVSRVTLWVHGEPREATIAGRGQAEHAYESVVSRAMDPILVTSAGPDRIRVRMFPVLVNDTMKARIGISQPALLDADGKPNFLLPHVIQGNVANQNLHHVWVEAPHAISGWKDGAVLQGEKSEPDKVRVDLKTDELPSFHVGAQARPAPEVRTAFRDQSLVQRVRLVEPVRIKDLIVVLDGGVQMDAHKAQIGKALQGMNAEQNTLIIAGDVVAVPFEYVSPDEARKQLDRLFSDFEFAGGRDNVQALIKARGMATSDTTIVWVHAGQPYTMSGLVTVPERERLKIYELQVDHADDVNVDTLHEAGILEAIPRRGTPAQDLSAWLNQYQKPTWKIERELILGAPVDESTYLHLGRIAANELVYEHMRSGHREKALELAAEFKIVTPVSAAIVLETQAQYDEFGLARAPDEGVPSIPEPHEWALIMMAFIALLVAVRKARANATQNTVGA